MDVLIIGRQVPTPSGPLDLLAVDGDGRLVVVENKRDRTPRDVLAQTIDYSSFISTLTLDEISLIYQTYRARSGIPDADLVEVFEEHFGEQLDTKPIRLMRADHATPCQALHPSSRAYRGFQRGTALLDIMRST